MDNRRELQFLQDALQHHIDQTRSLQNSIKRVLATKKESESKQQDQVLQNQLSSMSVELNNLQQKIKEVHNDGNPENPEPRGNSAKKSEKESDLHKRNPDPADQENTYQLKATMMPRIYSQSKALQAELSLFSRRNELRNQRRQGQVSYNRESNLSVATTLHLLNMHEKRTKEAERKAEALQAELDRRDGTEGSPRARQSASSGNQGRPQSHLSQGQVDDVMKRNQLLTEESHSQRSEIQRLKRENATLVLKAKHASQDRDQMLSQLSTSETARKELHTRFQKQKAQHDRLSKSLTRQSTDWIEARKQRDQEEEELRWRQVGHAAPHGAQGRTFSHPVPRNVDQPRHMYPVSAYAQPSAA